MKFQNQRSVVEAIRKMPTRRYLDYLRSPTWKQTRANHLRMYPTCECCQKRPSFQVHHVTYKRLGYELPVDLTALCVQCHHEIHVAVSEPLVAANDNEPRLPLVGGSIANGY
jgi:hypothetical protein